MVLRILLCAALAPVLSGVASAAPPLASVVALPDPGQYVEPDFDRLLFDIESLALDPARAGQMAEELVRVAYFLSDRPLASAKAIALAHALVPRHSGALVANFRLRAGRSPEEVTMIDPNAVASDLLQGAALILDRNPMSGAAQPVACLLDVIGNLPVDNPAVLQGMETLRRMVPVPDWRTVFPSITVANAGS